MAEPCVKICGLTRRQDAETAATLGADYLGAVLVPGSPRQVTPEATAELFRDLSATSVIVIADLSLAEAAAAARAACADVVQLHGEESREEIRALRQEGEWHLWKALRVRERREVTQAVEEFGTVVDGLLLDTWHPRLRGGTGETFPWGELAGIGDEIPPGVDLVVAGGLTPENVAEALAVLRPNVVDVSSGVESAPGVKDASRIKAFTKEIAAHAHRESR